MPPGVRDAALMPRARRGPRVRALALVGLLVAIAPGAGASPPTRQAVPPGPTEADLAGASPDRVVRIGLLPRDGRARIVSLPLESYVARVLAGEGEPRAGDAAQQTLAITARTYALANLGRHRRDGYDLCDTTHCQVLRPSTETTRRAAFATAGRILTFDGAPAVIFYSAWCGGRSELPSAVWPGAIDPPFEPSVRDDACVDEPGWQVELSRPVIQRALAGLGFEGRLRDVTIVERSGSGRVTRLRLDGLTPADISGNDFRLAIARALGPTTLRSTAFDLRATRAAVRFTGRGFGHGVGLCVVGAGRRSARGESAAAILAFYFPGLRLQDVADLPALAATLRPAARDAIASAEPVAPAVAPRSPRAAASGISIALAAPDEATRRLLDETARRSRDGLGRMLGTPVPGDIRLLVYDSAESFQRETGRPWWTNALTTGAVIELPPVALLRQRGVLERTLGEEIGRVLVEPALAGRPLWVRVGTARYYAARIGGEPPAPAARTAVRCPTDAELLFAVSAAAQRDADARAEACVARALAAGRSWRDVK